MILHHAATLLILISIQYQYQHTQLPPVPMVLSTPAAGRAKRPRIAEAREDARFIMGMLEGRWLASAEDAAQREV